MADIIPFRFTVMTDGHGHVYDSGDGAPSVARYFQSTCDEVNSLLGSAGDFLITTGDMSDAWPDSVDSSGKTNPEDFRKVIDAKFGSDFRWVTAVGNHDISALNGDGIQWIRDEWYGNNPNDQNRETTSDYAYPGPLGSSTTQYYFFHKGIMFIVMNWYWDGTTDINADQGSYSETYSGGIIVDAQLSWLRDLFAQYPSYSKIIVGHGNAFSFAQRHDDYTGLAGSNKDNRDRFWRLIEENNVLAYLHGHTHERRIDYIDNTYWSGGEVEDSWSYGTSKVPHICAGQIEPKWPISGTSARLSDENLPTFMNVTVTEKQVTFDIYEAPSVSSVDESWPQTSDSPYTIVDSTTVSLLDSDNKGGVWYYTQNKPGSEWVDKVSNSKGWSVDFNLRVNDVHNSQISLGEDAKGKGSGIYINDGEKQEVINFLPQEIVFSKADESVIYDTTIENDYRLIGKKNELKLFARNSGNLSYSEIANVEFSSLATSNGNAFNPNIFEDINGNLHAVWWGDGGASGSIFYSAFSEESWSAPESIVSLDNMVEFPSIIVDSNGNIYVAFESKQTEGSVIGFVYKDSTGWSDLYYIGQDVGYCSHPKMTFDSRSNVCVVWEDSRQEFSEIYINVFLKNSLQWSGEKKLSTNDYGSHRPSISSYMDNIYISWTQFNEDNYSTIEVVKYNSISSETSSVTTVSLPSGRSDFSSILSNVSGRIIIVWQDDSGGSSKIYGSVLSPSFDIILSSTIISNGIGAARYPVVSEQLSTSNVYIAWQDFKNDSYEGDYSTDIRPSNGTIYLAYYDQNEGTFMSIGDGGDVSLVFDDDRNIYNPSLPVFFQGELPIVYESYFLNNDEYSFIDPQSMFLEAKSCFYDLSEGRSSYHIGFGVEEYGGDGD
jgi:hypothetical protein